MTWQVLLLPGDGIGPEVLGAARPVMDVAARALEEAGGRGIRFTEAAVGGAAVDACGEPLPEETLRQAQEADAVLLGAVGGPRWDGLPPERRPEAGLLALRKALGVWANLRPVKTLPGQAASSPLRESAAARVDLLIVRELTGGLYFGRPRARERTAAGGARAVDTMEYTDAEIRRVAHVAFQAARARRRRVTSVDKANVLENSRLWREVVTEVAAAYPDVELEHQLVDSAAMRLVARPADYDVILTENLFGDILSDLAGGLLGGLGTLPSASLGDGRPGLYEPVHGSAPDIAGQDRANPAAAILSFALLCAHSLEAPWLAAEIEAAVAETMAEAAARGPWGTRETGRRVAARLEDRLAAPRYALLHRYNRRAAAGR
ncbi:MAG: 3-isopropylmalate dehydrogenase [Firmicutes bacterium]|nr:3-isopropylmalate dehydrogenase [Bacillota bacterium]